MSLDITKKHLSSGEYFANSTPKDTIYLHHTAGSHRPDWVIDWWNKDRSKNGNKIRVGTSYVIGGKSTRNPNDIKYDGQVYEAFHPSYWAHHLGLKSRKNTFLNQKSIGIEICNYGPLSLSNDGRFFTYVKTEVPFEDVVELDSPFRGHSYYQRYSDAQLETLEILLKQISNDFDIDLAKGLKQEIEKSRLIVPIGLNVRECQKWLNKNGFRDKRGMKLVEDGITGKKTEEAKDKVGRSSFEVKQDALEGYPGVWSHTSVRKDKFDIFPQPEIIQLLTSL